MRVKAYGIPALALLLASCGDKGAGDVEKGEIKGRVLPGSISDDMIALDQLKSQAPLEPRATGGGDAGEQDAADDAEDEAAAAPAPETESASETVEEPAASPASEG